MASLQPLFLTLQLMAVSVAIAAVIGILGAWAVSTSRSRLISGLFFASMVVALATPLILHAAAWEATAGKFGWLSLTQTGARGYGGFGGVFSGLVACGWIHGLFGSALVALATWHGIRRVPVSVLQQSQLDVGPTRAWWTVCLPIALPWITTALLATAALAATEMTVVDLYGYRTIADDFYLRFVADPTLIAVIRACLLPLLFAGAILFVLFSSYGPALQIQATLDDSARETTGDVNDASSQPLAQLACVVAIFVAALVVIVPLSGLIIKAGHEVVVKDSVRTVTWSAHRCASNVLTAPGTFTAEYKWTILLACMTGLGAVLIGWVAAAIGRNHRRYERLFDWASIAMVLIPGPIVGLAIVRFFQWDVPGFRTIYHQTLLPTVLGLLVRAAPVAYWIIRAGYRGIGQNVMDASQMESSWLRRMWSIDRPLLKRSLIGASLGAAVVASGDVPVMLPVIPPGVTTVGTRLFEQLHSGARYQEASLSLWYVAVVTIVAVTWARSVSHWRGRME